MLYLNFTHTAKAGLVGPRKGVQTRGRQLLKVKPHQRVQLILHRGISMKLEVDI